MAAATAGQATDTTAVATALGSEEVERAQWNLQSAADHSSAAHQRWEAMVSSLLATPSLQELDVADGLISLRADVIDVMRVLFSSHAARQAAEARSANQLRRLRAFESNMHALESEALSALISEGDVAKHQLEQIVDHISSPSRSNRSHSYSNTTAQEQQAQVED